MQVPFSEMLKSIPGAVGIRLEEELPYDVIKKIGKLEIRAYRPFTLARVSSSMDFEQASDHNFRALAEFIFGANDQNMDTAMTTPVFYDHKNGEWIMSFYIADEHAHLKPDSKEITVQNMPAKTVAAFEFSGVFDEESIGEAKISLLKELTAHGLVPNSDVWWAQFDQPVSLPFTKRNEALVSVDLK